MQETKDFIKPRLDISLPKSQRNTDPPAHINTLCRAIICTS